ncbi:MAG: ATP-binding cassette domain-containing protein [Candidatus Bathyarchaeia archaeon]
MSTPMILTDNLTKVYPGRIKAVDGVSIEVNEGEIYGFLGPNGAGKTTTIMMLITLVKPTAGRASVCGFDVVKHPAKVRESIGYVSQDVSVDENLTGRENLTLQGRFYHLPDDKLKRRVEDVLNMVDLTDRADDLVYTYSGGMRKRLDIAGGLIHSPKILFVDEPTLGLDIQTRRRIWDYIRHLKDEEGVTVFLTTHYMEEADALCDRIAIIDYGRVKVEGRPNELKSKVGGDIINLRLSKVDETFIKRVETLPFVEKVLPLQNSYNIVVDDGESSMPRIFDLANTMGVKIESISMKRPTLDEVFLAYTGRELRDEQSSREQIFIDRIRMRRIRG